MRWSPVVPIVAVLGAGCGSTPSAATCTGGGEPLAMTGRDTPEGFVPLEQGDPIPVEGAALYFDYEVVGLDTSEAVTVVLRLDLGTNGTDDYLASAALSCTDPGPARYSARADLPPPFDDDPASLDGRTIGVATVFTDVQGASAEDTLDLVVDVP